MTRDSSGPGSCCTVQVQELRLEFPLAVEVDRPADSLDLHGGRFKCLHRYMQC